VTRCSVEVGVALPSCARHPSLLVSIVAVSAYWSPLSSTCLRLTVSLGWSLPSERVSEWGFLFFLLALFLPRHPPLSLSNHCLHPLAPPCVACRVFCLVLDCRPDFSLIAAASLSSNCRCMSCFSCVILATSSLRCSTLSTSDFNVVIQIVFDFWSMAFVSLSSFSSYLIHSTVGRMRHFLSGVLLAAS